VIVVDASHWARGINAVKGTIPIVALVSNPLGEDLTSSLAAPGSSITGIATDTGPALLGKQYDLLLEAAPHLRHVACCGAIWPYAGMRTLWSDARQRGVSVQEFVVHSQFRHASRALRYADAFSALLRDGADAVLMLNDPEHLSNADAIADLGLRHRVPLVSPFRTLTEAGGLMSYGPDWDELERRRAVYVARILDGATPQELPFEQPSRFEFMINLKTAEALSITISPSLLARADEVIE
jgi:putative tryptophan/tyrosine transport system substrate-binding protein